MLTIQNKTKQNKQTKLLNPNAPPWTPDKQDTPNPLSTKIKARIKQNKIMWKRIVANYNRKVKAPSDQSSKIYVVLLQKKKWENTEKI